MTKKKKKLVRKTLHDIVTIMHIAIRCYTLLLSQISYVFYLHKRDACGCANLANQLNYF